jgi:hypothetical protein
MAKNFKGLIGVTLVFCSACVNQIKSEEVNQSLINSDSRPNNIVKKDKFDPLVEYRVQSKDNEAAPIKVNNTKQLELVPELESEVEQRKPLKVKEATSSKENQTKQPELVPSAKHDSCPTVNHFSTNRCVSETTQPQPIEVQLIKEDSGYIREVLMGFIALLSIISLLVNVSLWRKDKKNSVEEQFWIRDILMPDLNKAFKTFQQSAQSAPTNTVARFDSYYAKNMAPKRLALIGILHSIKKVHPPLFTTLNTVIFSIDDVFYTDDGDLQNPNVYMRDISYVWSDICKTIYEYQKSK